MAQVTLYVDKETEKLARAASQAAGLSLSRWVVQTIRDRISREWPDDIKDMAGAWVDLPTVEELRSGSAKDVPREQL